MIHKYILSLLLMGFAFSLSAQTLNVFDAETGAPLEMISVAGTKSQFHAVSNAAGKVNLTSFSKDENLSISMLGYKTQNHSYEQLKDAQFIVKLFPTTVNIDEVIISATRWRQNSGNQSAKITTVSPREIQFQNPQTAADLLNISGNVFLQKSQQGGGSPMIRGFATNRLLYIIDGVRMNTAIFRNGNLQNVISLDPFTIEQTEIFFGPGSVIYGSDAIGGVMSFQTLTPQFSTTNKTLISGNAVMRYATANKENTGHFHANIGGKKWASVTSISANKFDHLQMGKYGKDDYLMPYYVDRIDGVDVVFENKNPQLQIPSGYSQINMMQKIHWQPNSNWDLQYGFHYSETSNYSRYDRHTRTKNNAPRYGQWDYGPQIWTMNNMAITHSQNNVLYDQFTIRIAQQYFEESRIDRSLNDTLQNNAIEKVDAYSINTDFIKKWGNIHELYYGLEYVLNDVESKAFSRDIYTNERNTAGPRYPQSTWASYAIYATNHFQLTENLMLQTGMRYNQFIIDSKFDTQHHNLAFSEAHVNKGALTGNVGASYRPNQNWIFKGNLSTGFRSPNVDDMGKMFDSEKNSVTVPNKDLQAEYAYNADLGIAHVFNEWIKIDVTGFYTLLQNALVRRDFTLNGQDSIVYNGEMSKVQAIQNAAVTKVYGIQAGLEMNLPLGFGITSDLNYQKGEEELDDGTKSPSRHASPWFGITRLIYRAQNLQMQLYTQYSGEVKYKNLGQEEKGKPYLYAKDSDGNPYAPAWYTLNFKALYRVNDNLQITAGLENITDRRYRPYSSGIAAAGRNFILSVRATF